jgi:hypothetical protein
VFRDWKVSPAGLVSSGHGGQQSMLTVSGAVQARLNGEGQQLYASPAQGNGGQSTTSGGSSCPPSSGQFACYPFTLVKWNGQWRIANAPSYLLVDQTDFDRAWEPQDLYFFDPTRQVLVPDSVFVPIGTSENDLLNNLAAALQKGATSWLEGVTANVFPLHIAPVTVTADAPSATVYLKGTLTKEDQAALPYVMAELVWTLTSASVGQITGLQLYVNGVQWSQQPQGQKSYEKYDPYPAMPATFSYVDTNGAAQSLCGSSVTAAIGRATPVFTKLGAAQTARCGTSAPASTPSAPATTSPGHSRKPGQKSSATAYSMVAVSPDGKYVAAVSGGRNTVSIGSIGRHADLEAVLGIGSGISSISWDRQDNLWLTQSGNVWMVPIGGGKPYQLLGLSAVSALSVAPDGVRVALILSQPTSAGDLVLAAINMNGRSGSPPSPHASVAGPTLGQQVPLGPGITNSAALAWYDADNLIVYGGTSTSSMLVKVPVDGRVATQLTTPQTTQGATVASIAASNTSNVLVVGLSDGQLEVSAGSDGPWQAGAKGYEPRYGISSAP